MSARIFVPYYAEPGSLRQRNLRTLLIHLTSLDEIPLTVATDAGGSPGRARNHAVWINEDTIVFNDADTICPAGQIREAIRLAEEAPGLVFAYDLYLRLTAESTEDVILHGFPADPFGRPVFGRLLFEREPIFNSGSMGCVAISRACFEQVGGFDESYVGWGYEDLDFAQRCDALWPNRRVSGPVYHLWHGDRRPDDSPLDSDETLVRANADRFHVKT